MIDMESDFKDAPEYQTKEIADSTAELSPTAPSSIASPAARPASPATLQRVAAVPAESDITAFHTLGYVSAAESIDLVKEVVMMFDAEMRAVEIARVSGVAPQRR